MSITIIRFKALPNNEFMTVTTYFDRNNNLRAAVHRYRFNSDNGRTVLVESSGEFPNELSAIRFFNSMQ